jgi:hypothetical protein
MVPNARGPEALWQGLSEYIGREEDPDKLREVVININRLLTVVERRLAELNDWKTAQ